MRLPALVITFLFATWLVVPAAAQQPRNMVVNYGFEQGFDPYEDGEVGKGWSAYKQSGSVQFKSTMSINPEFTEKIEGITSQTLWSDGSSFVAGLSQKRGVTPGRFYKAWFATAAKMRGGGSMVRTVGLDPLGGTDPNAKSIVWGASYGGEKWATIEQGNAPFVRVPATGNQMTLFIKVMNGGGGQNQAYIDSVWLIDDGDAGAAGISAPNAPPADPPAAPPGQQPTATPQPPVGGRPPGTEGKDDYGVTNGWFYSQANGQDAGGNVGYVVSDDDNVPFYTAYRRYGGAIGVGYPISHRFMWDGFVSQAFQKVVFQFRPDQGGAVVFVNVFDQLSKFGKDDWLLTVRNVPKSNDWSSDNGKTWDQIVANHRKLLDPYPSIKTVYDISPDPTNLNGLPMGSQEFSNVIVVRSQRLVFQQWKIDVPWAKAGMVVIANGGDVAKEAGIYPPDSIKPQPSSYRLSPLPAVGAPPPNQPAAPPVAPANTPVPTTSNLPYKVVDQSFLPNCGLTQLRFYVVDSKGAPINGVIIRVQWAGADKPVETFATGKSGDAGWTDFIGGNRPINMGWKVSVVENGRPASDVFEVVTNDDCKSAGARQIATVTFRKG